jgi:DNA-binding NarL/FixJ family response regulator
MAVSSVIRILIADDHALLRDGLSTFIAQQEDMELVGEAQDGQEVIDAFLRLKPDVTLLDLQMPVVNGLTALEKIRGEVSDARIIVLTTYEGDIQALRAIKLGAQGYILKSALHRELGQAIRTVHAGRRHIQADIAEAIALAAVGETITPKETEVLRHAADGNSNKQIAYRMGLSEETVKTHMRNILGKLDAKDRSQAIVIALKRGIIDF